MANDVSHSLLLDKFFHYSPHLLCLLQEDGHLVDINPGWRQKLGIDSSDLAQIRFTDWVHPEDKEKVLRQLTKTEDVQISEQFQFRFVHDKTLLWLKGNIVYDPETKLSYGTFKNISKKVNLRENIRKAKEKVDFLFEVTSQAFNDFRDAEKSLGLLVRRSVPTVADWCSIDITDEQGEIQRIAVAHKDPEKVKFAYELQERYPSDPDAPFGYNHIMRTKESVFFPMIPHEDLVNSAQDEEHLKIILDLDLKSVIAVPIIAEQESLGVMSFVTSESGREYKEEDIRFLEDIGKRAGLVIEAARAYQQAETESNMRIEAQKSLKQKEELLSSIFNYASDHIFTVDREGVIFFINHVSPGLKREDVIGANIFSFQNQETEPIVREAIEKVFETGKPSYYETSLVLDDHKIDYASTVSPLFDEGEVYAVTIISRDVTVQNQAKIRLEENNELLEQKIAERTQELETANKELSGFAYSVSHDLRSPVRAMAGYSRIIIEDYGDDLSEDAKNCLDIISDEARRMGFLIDDLLEFSRMQRSEANMRTFNMGELLEQIILDTRADHPEADFDLKMPSSFPEVIADPNLLRQVWVNFLSNAIKYKKDTGECLIQINYESTDAEHIFSVQDNGVGFDMRYYSKLFGVFQRLHGDDEFEGTGIGLAIAKKVITHHKGRIWADSVLGEGSTFYFSLQKQPILTTTAYE